MTGEIEWETPKPPEEALAKFLSNWNLALIAVTSASSPIGGNYEKAGRLARAAVEDLFPLSPRRHKQAALSLLRRRVKPHDAYRALWYGEPEA